MESKPDMRVVWTHPDSAKTRMFDFMQKINQSHNKRLKAYWDLYIYSISNRAQFWAECIEFIGLIYSGSFDKAIDEKMPIDSMPNWFEGLTLNFAENILYARHDGVPSRKTDLNKQDFKTAVTEVREGGTEIKRYTWKDLRRDVSVFATALSAHGIIRGDRVMAVANNNYHTLCVMLAATWLGAIFSSVSTDMGAQGILERVLQITPKFIFMDDGAIYNGKQINLTEKMGQVLKAINGASWFTQLVSMPRFAEPKDVSGLSHARTLGVFLSQYYDQVPPAFEKISFNSSMLICYSSGTTGPPKCIVHSVGGILLNGAKEGALHQDIKPSDVALQYTTTGWIMYLAAVLLLLQGAQTVLYDGSPFYTEPTTFVKLLGDLGLTHFGTGPGWMQRLRASDISPRKIADLSNLRSVTSTGSILNDDMFVWFYKTGFPKTVHLANMSGGTDIAGCFALGNPLSPVYIGGCQGPALGMELVVIDSSSRGDAKAPLPHGEVGDLVAVSSFPDVPVYFWGDLDPTCRQSKLFSSYFAKYNHAWTQGDFVSIDPVTRGLHFYGRTDGVLNPSGVRFGSAEIYNVIERRFASQIADSLCVGKKSPGDMNEFVILFILMLPGKKFDGLLVEAINTAIKQDLSPRHVPTCIFETPEIPRTSNLKKVEIPVKKILAGERLKPSSTLINPESLEFYYEFSHLENKKLKGKL